MQPDGKGDPSARGLQPLAEILRDLLPGQRLVATSESALREAWPTVVGNLAARTSIVRFVDDRLLVAVESPAWMTELSFHRDEIRKRLLEAGLVVDEIRFVVAGRGPIRRTGEASLASSRRAPRLSRDEQRRVDEVTSAVSEASVQRALKRLFERALLRDEQRSAPPSERPKTEKSPRR
ncbi:MAG: DUF721 domain-containing protein [Myxococcales bacterium]|nr:DUF721 domain-containing protein [Myxococcales bacterium]